MTLDSAIAHLLQAKRISAASQSYAKDNPSEWGKVKAYLEGGARPSGVTTQMGLGLIEVEDERRGAVPAPEPTWTSSIADGATIPAGTVWSVTVSPAPDSVEFWAGNTKLATDTSSPYEVALDLPAGQHVLGVCAWHDSTRTCFEDRRNISVTSDEPSPGIAPFTVASYEGYSSVNSVPLWAGRMQAKASDRMTIVDDPLGQHGKVMRVEVRPGDSNVANSGSWERANVYATSLSGPMQGRIETGKILAVSIGILIPTSTPSGEFAPWLSEHNSGSGQVPCHFSLSNGTSLDVRYLGGNPSSPHRVDADLGTIAKGIWHRVVYSHFYSPLPAVGRVMVAVDGAKLLDRNAANIYTGDTSYHKQGWYRPAETFAHVMYLSRTKFYTAASVEAAFAAALTGGY